MDSLLIVGELLTLLVHATSVPQAMSWGPRTREGVVCQRSLQDMKIEEMSKPPCVHGWTNIGDCVVPLQTLYGTTGALPY